MFGLSTVGVFLYFLFFVSLISFSMYVSRTKEVTVESYFFANRNIHWLMLGVSLLTPSFFSPYIFGLSLSGTSELIIVYGIISAIMLVILGWFLIPLYLKLKINTLPEYFEKRFNRACRLFISSLYIFYNIFIRLIVILVTGSIIISTIRGVDTYSSLLFFLIITGIYVITGGLHAEIYVNVILVSLIAIGIAGFSLWAVYQSDGINSAIYKIAPSTNYNSGSTSTWSNLMLGLPILGFWFWCTDQFIVQKTLSARTTSFARKATLFSGFLQIIPILIFILPGIISIKLFQDAAFESSMHSLFSGSILPETIKAGLIIAVAAVLMGSFAGLFNSTSSLITFDFYRNLRPAASDRKLVLVGRLTTIFLVLFSILLIPLSQNMDFNYSLKLFETFAYFAALVTGVFLTGLLNKKINSFSALATLSVGTVIILLRSLLNIIFDYNPAGNGFFSWFIEVNFLVFSFFIFLLSIFSLFLFSRLTLVQLASGSFLRILKEIFLKLKIRWNFNKTVFLILLVLVIIVTWGVLF